MVPAARLELARPKSTDFKSVVSTDSTKQATPTESHCRLKSRGCQDEVSAVHNDLTRWLTVYAVLFSNGVEVRALSDVCGD